jgi:hypothetical protein
MLCTPGMFSSLVVGQAVSPNATWFSPKAGFGSAGDLVAGTFRAENNGLRRAAKAVSTTIPCVSCENQVTLGCFACRISIVDAFFSILAIGT